MAGARGKRFTLIPQDHTVLVKQTTKWSQIIILTLASLGVSIIGTAYIYRIDEIVTAQGVLVAEEGAVDIMSPVTGKVKKVYPQNGQRVEKGDLLIEYDIENEQLKLSALVKQKEIESIRRNEKLQANSKNLESNSRNIKLMEGIVDSYKGLREVGAIARLQFLREQNRLEEIKDQKDRLILQRQEIITQYNLVDENISTQIEQLRLILKKGICTPRLLELYLITK